MLSWGWAASRPATSLVVSGLTLQAAHLVADKKIKI
jgi:hypothetical protein